MTTALLIDGNFLAHRAWHTTGGLAFGGRPTGVAYGYLRELDTLEDEFRPDIWVHAFDAPGSLRALVSPAYKAHRKPKDDEEREKRRDIREQIKHLRRHVLAALGYKNIWSVKGYEGDDIIAKAAEESAGWECDEVIIVSSDNDLLQCLCPGVSIYNPIKKTTTTDVSFKREWGIDAPVWPHVKAYAGDSSDGVVGVPGVGLKLASAYYAGKLKQESKAWQKINGDEGIETHNRNIGLVRLPYPGLEIPDLRPDELAPAKRLAVRAELGFQQGQRGKKRKPKKGGFGLTK